jgi:acyl-coenzyme A synthetase/AMP-(fatty) acid ligase
MLGYWKDPGMSGAVIRDGWLRTGDLAYQDNEGYFYIAGRSSEMIKTGAHRINPAEIEEVILELDGVEEVAAIGVKDELLGHVIKVVIVPSVNAAPDARSIQAHCKKNMANFKVPKYIEFVSDIPKTASGKVQRYLLQNEPMG